MCTQPEPAKKELPPHVLRWSVHEHGQEPHNYGQVHDMIHRDIAIGNDYRKERIKLLTALATGVFALTVTFHKDLFASKVSNAALIWLLTGWGLLLISLLAGIEHFRKWEDFYLAHRASGIALWKYRTAASSEEKERAADSFYKSGQKIDALRESYKIWNWVQSLGLVVGLGCVAIYVGLGAWDAKPPVSAPISSKQISQPNDGASKSGASAAPAPNDKSGGTEKEAPRTPR